MPRARIPTAHDWSGPEPAWPTLGLVVRWLARLQFAVTVSGDHHVPREGPVVVMANHTSHLDPLVALLVLHHRGRRPRFLALADLWQIPVVGHLLTMGHMIPVTRGRDPGRMRDAVLAALDAGQAVVVYPEGSITPPGQVRAPRRGVGMLALATTAPVVPIAMIGVPPWTGRPRRLRIPVEVRVGAPLQLPAELDPASRNDQRVAAELALGAIRSLHDPAG